MAVVASGHVGDRPFARAVAAIASKRFTGALVLTQQGRTYTAAWERGYVVAADSPLSSDAPARVALTAGFVDSTQLGDALRVLQQSPGKTQLEVLAEIAKLSAEQIVRVRQSSLAHKAMRIFALPDARFELHDETSLAPEPGVTPIDPRWLIYQGLCAHYSDERLAAELAALGDGAVMLAEGAENQLAAFGFGAAEKPALAAIRGAAGTVDSLAGVAPDLGRTRLGAMLYALLATGCGVLTGAPAAAVAAPAPEAPEPPRAPKQKRTPGAVRFRKSKQPPAGDATEVRALIAERLAVLDRRGDHFALLGVERDATPNQVRLAYFDLAKRLHPDKLRAAGVDDVARDAHRLFAHINEAFNVLSSPARRAEYMEVLAAGGVEAKKKQEADAEALAAKLIGAEQAFLRGRHALRGNAYQTAREAFAEAVELNPEDGEHHAMLGWATWCAADDKEAAFKEVNKSFKRAIALSPKNVSVYLFRGRVAKQRGFDDTAEECFRKVAELDPDNRDAELELRLLAKRRGDDGKKKGKDEKKGGLFGRFKRS